MKSLNKKIFFSAFIVGLLITIGIIVQNANDSRLSAQQVASLREQYPIAGIELPMLISIRNNIPLSEVIEFSDSFVYGEVLGDVSLYWVDASTGNTIVDEKRAQNGIAETYTFYEYTISVIDDSEGKYEKGDQITITANIDFIDYNPKLEEGMQVVVPVVKDEHNDSRHSYCIDGFYYVTDSGHAISAFDDTDSSSQKSFSGVTVEQLLNKLKK